MKALIPFTLACTLPFMTALAGDKSPGAQLLGSGATSYTAWGAGLTLAAGGSAVYMKNEHGVVIKLLSKTTGLRFNLSGNGIKVQLQS